MHRPSTRPPVYVCAPYAPGELSTEENVERACALARLAAMTGFAPIVVHPGIAPIFGADTADLRAIGLDVDVALVQLVATHPRGQLWALMPDSGVPSAGMRLEIEAWLSAPTSGPLIAGHWSWWLQRTGAAGPLEGPGRPDASPSVPGPAAVTSGAAPQGEQGRPAPAQHEDIVAPTWHEVDDVIWALAEVGLAADRAPGDIIRLRSRTPSGGELWLVLEDEPCTEPVVLEGDGLPSSSLTLKAAITTILDLLQQPARPLDATATKEIAEVAAPNKEPGGPRALIRLPWGQFPPNLGLNGLCGQIQRWADEHGAPAALNYDGKDIVCFPGEHPSMGAERWRDAWGPAGPPPVYAKAHHSEIKA
jgi:hypothetical protein